MIKEIRQGIRLYYNRIYRGEKNSLQLSSLVRCESLAFCDDFVAFDSLNKKK